ncbi:MAG: cupin domain-containing protein [Clostridiaceae bacterium]|jgi:mannose-6-phosphate isomerase-like protein (cupin superfamily)|nr:cupin domain-containing protein [Clostridiaceae bacterium]
MIRRAEEKVVIEKSDHMGGEGKLIIRNLLNDPSEMYDKGRVFCHTSLEPGSSIGYHTHHDESETYYIYSGIAEYNDNGTLVELRTGDVAFTASGEGHGIKNIGNEPLELIALIIYK